MIKSEKPIQKKSLVVGDEVFFSHPSGAKCGKVVAHGKHGATIKEGKVTHKVKHENILGHKSRKAQTMKLVHEGEDGMIAADESGKHHFFNIPPEAREDQMMVKSFGDYKGRLVTIK